MSITSQKYLLCAASFIIAGIATAFLIDDAKFAGTNLFNQLLALAVIRFAWGVK